MNERDPRVEMLRERLEIIDELEAAGAAGSGFGYTFDQMRVRAAEQLGLALPGIAELELGEVNNNE